MTRLALTAVLALTAIPALAQDLATGDAIRTAVAGNTVQGTMSDASAYTEFYAEDGVIKGKDYVGVWTIEGDKMCFAYDAPATCYGVKIAGDQVTWVSDTADAGTGTILPGNPNNF
ncbi:MAG: hypothetical protein ACRC14_05585 [Paracoccaceae bacterium]